MTSGWSGLTAKGLGALAGAVMSLAVWRPHSFLDGFLRLTVGVVGGIVFGPVLLSFADGYLGALTELEKTLAGGAAVAAFIWPTMGKAGEVIRSYRRKDGDNGAD